MQLNKLPGESNGEYIDRRIGEIIQYANDGSAHTARADMRTLLDETNKAVVSFALEEVGKAVGIPGTVLAMIAAASMRGELPPVDASLN